MVLWVLAVIAALTLVAAGLLAVWVRSDKYSRARRTARQIDALYDNAMVQTARLAFARRAGRRGYRSPYGW